MMLGKTTYAAVKSVPKVRQYGFGSTLYMLYVGSVSSCTVCILSGFDVYA